MIASIVGALYWFSFASLVIHAPTANNFGYDFAINYAAAKTLLSGGDIYRVPFENSSWLGADLQLPFPYPQPAIFFFVPFAYLSFEQARVAVAAIYVVALLFSIFFTTKILRYYGVRLSALALLLLIVSLFLFEPVVQTFTSLNPNLILLLLITVFYYLLFVKKKPGLSGLVLGLASLIKVFPVILVLLGFLRGRSKKLIVTTIATITVLFAVSLSFLGLQTLREFIEVSLNHFTIANLSREAILAPVLWDPNVSPVLTILKVVALLNLSVDAALLILNIVKVVFIVGVCMYLFRVSKIKKDPTKLKEWEVLSFTALLLSVLLILNVTWSYYTTYLVLSFILIIYIIPLTRSEKAVFWLALALFATRVAVGWVFWRLGDIPKTVAFIIGTPTIAYILLTVLVFYIIRDRTQRGHWKTPA